MSKRQAKLNDLDVDPHMVDRVLREFRRTAEAVDAEVAKDPSFAGKWVGGYGGKIVASGDTMKAVLRALESQGIPKGKAVVYYVEKGDRVLLL